ARRRVSARTTAPSAPAASSSQRNQKRSCPGVPNRYRTMSLLIVIRPKSMTTVVLPLASTPARSSVAALASVRISSVCSGRISRHDPTIVVLPTPNPPATKVLSARGARVARPSEGAETIDDRLQDVFVWWVDAGVGVEG